MAPSLWYILNIMFHKQQLSQVMFPTLMCLFLVIKTWFSASNQEQENWDEETQPSDNYTVLVTVLVMPGQSISLADFSNHIIKTTLLSFTNKSLLYAHEDTSNLSQIHFLSRAPSICCRRKFCKIIFQVDDFFLIAPHRSWSHNRKKWLKNKT